LPLHRRASHTYGSENQLDQERPGASEGRENASSYAAAHPGPRRSDPTPYGATTRSLEADYGSLLPGYGLRGVHAHAAAVAAASYYHGHPPPDYPAGAYPPPFGGPAHRHGHGHGGGPRQGSKQDGKATSLKPGQQGASPSTASGSASNSVQATSLSVQAIPEHQKVSAA